MRELVTLSIFSPRPYSGPHTSCGRSLPIGPLIMSASRMSTCNCEQHIVIQDGKGGMRYWEFTELIRNQYLGTKLGARGLSHVQSK